MEASPNITTDFIRSRFLEKKKANPQYSLTAFARDLGLSVSFLSRLLNGERPLTLKLAIQIAALFKMSNRETEQLVNQVVTHSSDKAKITRKMRESILKKKASHPVTHFEIARFKAISQWYHLAILNLTFTKNFDPSPASIARRLGITKIEASDAIARLIELGLLERADNKLRKTTSSLMIQTNRSEQALREFQLQTMQKAVEIIKDPSQETYDRRVMPGSTLAIDARKLPLLRERLREFQLEFAELARSESYDEVYQLNLHFFPLTQTPNETKE